MFSDETTEAEAAKYEKVWLHPEYAKCSPGEAYAHDAMERLYISRNGIAYDFGTGSGKGAKVLLDAGFNSVIGFDYCEQPSKWLAETNTGFMFVKAALHEMASDYVVADFGLCADVMEHLPEQIIDDALRNMQSLSKTLYLGICTVEDMFGKTIGEQLHLTVRPCEWWLERIGKVCGNATIIWRDGISCGIVVVNDKFQE